MGVFRVHPLIMTLGISLVVLGLANVWQLQMVQTGAGVPPGLRTLGIGTILQVIPYSLVVFVPIMLLILLGLRRTGYGRLLYAIGDNPIAARLSGARAWQVLVAAVRASRRCWPAIAGFLISGLTNVASVTLADSYVLPSVAAAVIGGTSIMGGRGGFGGTIVGALILTVVGSLLTSLGLPGSGPPDPVRRDHRRRRGRVHAGDRRRPDGARATRRRPAGTSGSISAGRTSSAVVVEHDADAWRVIDREQVPTMASDGPDAVVGRLVEVGATGDGAVPGRHHRSGSVCPGLYDPAAGTTRFLVNFPASWAGVPVAGPVGAALGVPPALINDARAFGLAELRLGAGARRRRR